ncbi:MAG: hypothetical protein ABIR68_10095 [Ilumatobacteraceae bacterium]
MTRRVDRRAVFFVLSALLSIALLPLCPPELRWVGWSLGAAFIVLATASWADHRTRLAKPPR